MKQLLALLALIGCIWPAQAQIQTGADVAVTETASGKVRGFVQNGVFTYKGIPYATAGRFEAPRPVEAWDGVRSSMTWGPVAPLMTPTTSVQDESEFVFNHDWGYTSEECLVLNVWTPSIDDGKKLPVMFWIHGGGFTAGSSQELPSYHGENLAKSGDVVVVSINHRLNVLGFLDLSAFDDKFKTSANNSMLDIVAALEWVNENIGNFGGDPENVTIFGQSGGGAKVNTLMAMPSAKGLFHKAVNQSGAFRSALQTKEVTRMVGAETLKELGISEENVEEIQSVPFWKLSEASQKALKTVEGKLREQGQQFGMFGLSWGPSVDGEVLPYQMLSEEVQEMSKGIPLMIGTVKNEFMASLGTGLTHASQEEIDAFIAQRYGDKAEAYKAAVKEAYPNASMPSDMIDVDFLFRPGAVAQAKARAAMEDAAPVYMYMFSWQSPVMDGKYKAIHCMELAFVFNNIERCWQMNGSGEDAYELAEKVSQAWVNFAYTGNPNHDGLPEWPVYSVDGGATMFFDNDCHIRHHHDAKLLELMAQN